jgi:hypothetical protein
MLRAEKRLIESVVYKEELRFYYRVLSGRLNFHAERYLEVYRKNRPKDPILSKIFFCSQLPIICTLVN